jgi:hypothetical protein
VDIIQAALLHDTVEDTDTSFDEIEAEFGVNVCHLVRELTDNKSLPKAERKRLQVMCLLSFQTADHIAGEMYFSPCNVYRKYKGMNEFLSEQGHMVIVSHNM